MKIAMYGEETRARIFKCFMDPINRFRGINSASLCSLAGRYDNSIPTRFLALFPLPHPHTQLYTHPRIVTPPPHSMQLPYSHRAIYLEVADFFRTTKSFARCSLPRTVQYCLGGYKEMSSILADQQRPRI
jgi:hypothetical protein